MRTLLILLLSTVAALAQPVFPPAFWAPTTGSAAPDNSVPPTNMPWFRAVGNPIANSSGNTAENFVYDSGSQLYILVSGNGSNVGLWTNGVNPLDRTKWAFLSNAVTDSASTPTPTLLTNGGHWYCFYNTLSGITVASNTTAFGPFTNAALMVSHGTGGWDGSRVLENYVFKRQDGVWVMLYMGDSGGTTEQVGYATASNPDGPYTKYSGNPLIPFGAGGQFDAGTVADPWCVYWNGTYYIGYAASPDKNPPWETGMASTTDWTNITKLGAVFPTNSTAGAWDSTNAFRGAVTKVGRNYILTYAGDDFEMGIASEASDNLSPVVTNTAASPTTSIVSFNTDIPANCGVAYGTSPGTYTATNAEAVYGGYSHAITLTTSGGNTYYYSVHATNYVAGGASTNTPELNFTTPSLSTPTNISGYPSLAWYCVSSNYTTNSGTLIMADLYTNHFDLTNQETAKFPARTAAGVNGFDYANFIAANNTYLKSVIYTSTQPTEVVMVMSMTNTGTTLFLDSANTAARQFVDLASQQLQFGAATTLSVANFHTTNKWAVFNFVYNGASSEAYTNNVLGVSGNAGSQSANGLTLGQRFGLTLPSSMSFAEMSIYSTNLDTFSRSNLFYYFTNKYAIGP